MKRFLFIALLSALCALPVCAQDIATVLRWDVQTERPAKVTWPIVRGETVILEPCLTSYGAAKNFTAATNVWLNYRAVGDTNWYAAPASVYNATGGVLQSRWDSSLELTNSLIEFDFSINSPSATVRRASGYLKFDSDVTYQAGTSSVPVARTSIDWATLLMLNLSSCPFLTQWAAGAGLTNAGTAGSPTGALSSASVASLAKADAAYAWATAGDAFRIIQSDTQAWLRVTGNVASVTVVTSGQNPAPLYSANSVLIVTGAGTADANGTFYPWFDDINQLWMWTTESASISWSSGSGCWILDDGSYVYTNGTSAANPTLGSWITAPAGSNPAPTVVYATFTNSYTVLLAPTNSWSTNATFLRSEDNGGHLYWGAAP